MGHISHLSMLVLLKMFKKPTNTYMVLGECDRLPIYYTYFTTCIKYWCKLLTLSDHRYPKNCYMLLKRLDEAGRIHWATNVKKYVIYVWFGYVWVAQEVGNIDVFLCQFRQRLK